MRDVTVGFLVFGAIVMAGCDQPETKPIAEHLSSVECIYEGVRSAVPEGWSCINMRQREGISILDDEQIPVGLHISKPIAAGETDADGAFWRGSTEKLRPEIMKKFEQAPVFKSAEMAHVKAYFLEGVPKLPTGQKAPQGLFRREGFIVANGVAARFTEFAQNQKNRADANTGSETIWATLRLK